MGDVGNEQERMGKKSRKKLFYAHTSNFVLLFTASSESPSSPVANGVSILPLPREVGGASDVVAPPKTNQNKNNTNKTIPKLTIVQIQQVTRCRGFSLLFGTCRRCGLLLGWLCSMYRRCVLFRGGHVCCALIITATLIFWSLLRWTLWTEGPNDNYQWIMNVQAVKARKSSNCSYNYKSSCSNKMQN